MKRFSAPPVYADPSRPPDDDDSDASSVSDGSKKVKTAQSFESLFNSEALSDIILDINGGEYVFHAHKMIVGLKSERLAALINSASSMPLNNNSGKPVLYLQELPDCSAVFSRFLYFIYSGAVWLHRDYVVPLFKLSTKYGVGALATHCENYIVQILNKMHSQDPAFPLTQSLTLTSTCDLFEESRYREETKKGAFRVLCKRFIDLTRTERWITLNWLTVRDLLHSDECTCEENLILVSATDWMKRNKLQDKAQIQEILSCIRYPRLPRRVLYHLHATSSFKKFPPVQDLIDAAIRFHCFKDVPEAQAEFTGLQYRPRGCCDVSVEVGVDAMLSSPTDSVGADYNNISENSTPDENQNSASSFNAAISLAPVITVAGGCQGQQQENQNPDILLNNYSNSISSTTTTTTAAISPLSTLSTLPIRRRSRSEDRHGSSPQRFNADNRVVAGSLLRPRGNRLNGLESSVSTFHSSSVSSSRSPVAAVPPRVQRNPDNTRHGDQIYIDDDNNNNNNNDNDSSNNDIQLSSRYSNNSSSIVTNTSRGLRKL